MAKHRAWRVFIEASGNDGRHCQVLNRTEFREDYDTPDLIRSAGGTGFASSGSFNGDFWHSSCATTEAFVGWDFGNNPQDIGAVYLQARIDNTYGSQDAPVRARIEWSDDMATWTTDWRIVQQHGWGSGEGRVFCRQPGRTDAGGHRYWRLLALERAGDGTYSGFGAFRLLRNGRVESSYGTPIVAPGLQYWIPWQVFGPQSGWSDGIVQYPRSVDPQWMGYDFGPGQAPLITSFLASPNRDSINRTWRSFAVEHSDDGVNWTRTQTYNPGTLPGRFTEFAVTVTALLRRRRPVAL